MARDEFGREIEWMVRFSRQRCLCGAFEVVDGKGEFIAVVEPDLSARANRHWPERYQIFQPDEHEYEIARQVAVAYAQARPDRRRWIEEAAELAGVTVWTLVSSGGR